MRLVAPGSRGRTPRRRFASRSGCATPPTAGAITCTGTSSWTTRSGSGLKALALEAYAVPRHTAARVAPSRAIPGGRIVVEAGDSTVLRRSAAERPSSDPPRRGCRLRPRGAWPRRRPAGRSRGVVPIRLGDGEPIGGAGDRCRVGQRPAPGGQPRVRQRRQPLRDLSAARAASRVPVSVFRVRPGGAPEPVASGIVNATSLAFDPFGELCVSSRFDGAVYRVEARRDGREGRVRPRRGVRPGVRARRDDVRRRPDRHAVPRERGGPRGAVRGPAAEHRRVPRGGRPRGGSVRERADALVPRSDLPRRSPGRSHRLRRKASGGRRGSRWTRQARCYAADSLAGASGVFRRRAGTAPRAGGGGRRRHRPGVPPGARRRRGVGRRRLRLRRGGRGPQPAPRRRRVDRSSPTR